MSNIASLLATAYTRFNENEGMSNAASIAYYAAFSLPAILLLLIAIVGIFVEPRDVEGAIGRNIRQVAGREAAQQVEGIVAAAQEPEQSTVAMFAGSGMLLLGSMGVLVQLQAALNRVWHVEAQPNQNSWVGFFVKRALSLGMLLVIAFLLLVTISVRALLSELGTQLDAVLPSPYSSGMISAFDQLGTFLVLSVLLAAMFRFLPDAKVPMRNIWFGALVTAALFGLGKQAMSIYLSYSHPGQLYGAAGSLIVLLMWVYYASIIVLFGAQLTQSWSERSGERVNPEDHAIPADSDN